MVDFFRNKNFTILTKATPFGFVYPPSTSTTSNVLTVQGTKNLGDKAGLCEIYRRATAQWPEFTRTAHPGNASAIGEHTRSSVAELANHKTRNPSECFVTARRGMEQAFRERVAGAARAGSADVESNTGSPEFWLFKSLAHNTYGGLSIMFYDAQSGLVEVLSRSSLKPISLSKFLTRPSPAAYARKDKQHESQEARSITELPPDH